MHNAAFKEFALQFAASGLFSTADNRRALLSLDDIQPCAFSSRWLQWCWRSNRNRPTDR